MTTEAQRFLRPVPDFPIPGINFLDIGPLLANGPAWRRCISGAAESIRPYEPELLVAFDARGFLFAGAIAIELGCGVLMARKAGKMPGPSERIDYGLEYGKNTLELQSGNTHPGQRVVLIDDVLATGGTLAAGRELCDRLQLSVEAAWLLIDIPALNGRDKLPDLDILVHWPQ